MFSQQSLQGLADKVARSTRQPIVSQALVRRVNAELEHRLRLLAALFWETFPRKNTMGPAEASVLFPQVFPADLKPGRGPLCINAAAVGVVLRTLPRGFFFSGPTQRAIAARLEAVAKDLVSSRPRSVSRARARSISRPRRRASYIGKN